MSGIGGVCVPILVGIIDALPQRIVVYISDGSILAHAIGREIPLLRSVLVGLEPNPAAERLRVAPHKGGQNFLIGCRIPI